MKRTFTLRLAEALLPQLPKSGSRARRELADRTVAPDPPNMQAMCPCGGGPFDIRSSCTHIDAKTIRSFHKDNPRIVGLPPPAAVTTYDCICTSCGLEATVEQVGDHGPQMVIATTHTFTIP